jgi:MFS family permease
MGRLSDTYGRKPFIVGNLTVTMLMELVMFFRSHDKNSLVAAGIVSTASMTGFLTILRAGLSDRLSGTDLGVANAQTGMAAGLAVVVGPFIAGAIASRFSNRSVYLLAAAVTACNVATIASKMGETLEPKKRKPMDWAETNPFTFLKLLTNGPKLRLCAMALAVQCIAEPRFIFPYVSISLGSKKRSTVVVGVGGCEWV